MAKPVRSAEVTCTGKKCKKVTVITEGRVFLPTRCIWCGSFLNAREIDAAREAIL